MENKLNLWGWYSPQTVVDQLIPEIEKNCRQYGIKWQAAYEIFQKNKFAQNSLYFHHGYAQSDIPIGQEYEEVWFIEDYKLPPVFVQRCHAKILCFFTAGRTQPSESAMQGHHELSLIQFEQGIPQIIYDELPEITEQSPLVSTRKRICLSSKSEAQV